MSKKTRITITMDEKVFEDFKKVLPSYITVSGVIDSLVREYMAGYYKFDWSIDEMFDVLRGKTTATYLQKVHELGIKDFPPYMIDSALAEHAEEERLQEEADLHFLEEKQIKREGVIDESSKDKRVKTKKGG